MGSIIKILGEKGSLMAEYDEWELGFGFGGNSYNVSTTRVYGLDLKIRKNFSSEHTARKN